jgi:non-heme chloroperoxidase
LPHAEHHEIEGGPHNIGWTHAEELNPLFAEFLRK